MYYTDSGDEMKKFNTKDGMGILKLSESNIKTGILSSGFKTNIGYNRAKMLNVNKIYIGRESKFKVLQNWLVELNLNLDQVAYIGDDINDLEILANVGLSACPFDAVKKVKETVDIILTKNGGDGCVREFIDEYLLSNSEELQNTDTIINQSID